jgi:hypothetical protein
MRKVILVCFLLVLAVALHSEGVKPPNGFVPDAATAVRVAEAVLTPIYGEKMIQSERPYAATLTGDIWTVNGTLPCPEANSDKSVSCTGGVATVKISKADAHIIFMWHGK